MSELNLDRVHESNITNILAKERNREAAERTLLAWLRTCLSFISFGFGIYKIVQTLAGENATQQHPVTFVVAIGFILLGSIAMIAATAQHIKTLRLLEDEPNPYMPKSSLGVGVSVVLIIIGLFASIAIIAEFFLL